MDIILPWISDPALHIIVLRVHRFIESSLSSSDVKPQMEARNGNFEKRFSGFQNKIFCGLILLLICAPRQFVLRVICESTFLF